MCRFYDSQRTPGHAPQRGIVLVLALVFLLLSTLLAAGAVGQALLQERMAGGQRQAQLAQMAAESALRGAEWRLWRAASAAPVGDCRDFEPAQTYRGSDGSHDFTMLTGLGLDDDTRRTAVLAENPSYRIENLGPAWPSAPGTAAAAIGCVYRITARATGGHADAVRVAQGIFAAGGD